jgi:hypothetical protein
MLKPIFPKIVGVEVIIYKKERMWTV